MSYFSSLFSELLALLDNCWGFSTRHPGIVLVLIGVFGEGGEILSKIFFEHWYKKYERPIDIWAGIFWIVVILGLAWEIPEASKSDVDISKAQQAAEEARFLADNVENTNAQLVADNLVLRSNVVTLEEAVQWRTIGPIQETNLINLLAPFSQENLTAIKTVQISTYEGTDFEALRYAKRIKSALIKCGFDAKIRSSGIDLSGQDNLSEMPTGLCIAENGYKPTPSMIAIVKAFNAVDIKMIPPEILTNFPPDEIVRIMVFPKP